MKKLGKKQIGIISASAVLVVAAAVAIPVGVIYGSPSSAANNAVQTDLTDDPDQLQTWTFGSEGSNKPAPTTLPEDKGFVAADFDASQGILLATNVVIKGKNPTKPATEGLYATYEYPAKAGNLRLQLTYKVDLQKASPGKMDGLSEASKGFVDLPYGSAPPSFDFDSFLLKNFPGYFAVAEEPTYFNSAGAPLTASDLPKVGAGGFFEANYAALLDLAYANPNSLEKGVYKFRYNIKQAPLATPTQLSEKGSLTVGAAFTLPEPKAPAEGYKLASTTPATAITVVSPKPAGGTPGLGGQINAADVGNYDFGAAFKVTYSYIPVSANYSGNYDYSFEYAIDKENKVVPPSDRQLPVLNYGAYNFNNGNFPYANSIGTIPPAPVNPKGSFGYIGTYDSAKIAVQSEIDNAASPKAGSPFIFGAADVNAGTEIELSFKYVPRAGFIGDTITMRQILKILNS